MNEQSIIELLLGVDASGDLSAGLIIAIVVIGVGILVIGLRPRRPEIRGQWRPEDDWSWREANEQRRAADKAERRQEYLRNNRTNRR